MLSGMKSPAEKNIAILNRPWRGWGIFYFSSTWQSAWSFQASQLYFLSARIIFFLSQIAAASNALETKLMRADGFRYGVAIARVWILSLSKKVLIVNSFHFTHLRLSDEDFLPRCSLAARPRDYLQEREGNRHPVRTAGIYRQRTYLAKKQQDSVLSYRQASYRGVSYP